MVSGENVLDFKISAVHKSRADWCNQQIIHSFRNIVQVYCNTDAELDTLLKIQHLADKWSFSKHNGFFFHQGVWHNNSFVSKQTIPDGQLMLNRLSKLMSKNKPVKYANQTDIKTLHDVDLM